MENERVHFFTKSKGAVANKKAPQGSGRGIQWHKSIRHSNTNGIHTDRGTSVLVYMDFYLFVDTNDDDYADIDKRTVTLEKITEKPHVNKYSRGMWM